MLWPSKKPCDILTVNNPAKIELQKLSTKFEADNPDIKLNWVVVEENILGHRSATPTAFPRKTDRHESIETHRQRLLSK
jgi:sorbitol/mannitol transport system substrate-binding protein